MVYGLDLKPTQGYYVEYECLDGDPKKIRLIDASPDEGGKVPLGGGRAIDSAHMPTRIRWLDQKKQPLGDFDGGPAHSVSAKAKALIEELEPGVHQLLPVDFHDIDGRFQEHRWFLIVCNRLDTIDRAHVQGFILKSYPGNVQAWVLVRDLVRRNEVVLIPPGYDTTQPSKLVFNRVQIGSAHLWVDKHLSGGIWVSDDFQAACCKAGLTGMHPDNEWMETV